MAGRSARSSYRAWRVAAHLGAWLPLVYLAWRYSADEWGVNPVQTITRVTGRAALGLLIVSLACTPANTLLGLRGGLTVRRALGLYAFGYAVLHLFTFVGIDYGFDWSLIRADALIEKRYILVGLTALTILLPLALTSTRGWMKRLGRDWKRLHRGVYIAAALGAVHYLWLVKAIGAGPVLAALIVAVLLTLRVPVVRRGIGRLRSVQHPEKQASRDDEVHIATALGGQAPPT